MDAVERVLASSCPVRMAPLPWQFPTNLTAGRACPQRAETDVLQARRAARRDGLALPTTGSWAANTPERHRLLSTIPPAAPPTTNTVTVVDVLVAYTPEARIGAGSKESIESSIKLAVAEANTVYQNSQADVRLRLVHLREVGYSEFPSNATNLNRLQSRSDSFLDKIHLIRETNRADLVCLITEHSDPGTSGLAFTMGAPSFAFRDSAFTVVKRADLLGSYIFVHEISHNFGAQHDREHALDAEGKLKPGSYPFSFGYRFVLNDTIYRDVMSYAPGESIPYLSNPDISFMAVPIGLPGTTNGANNALTVNANALLVADFFGPAVQTVPPAIRMLAPTNGTILKEGANLVIAAHASDIGGAVRQIEFFHENVSLRVTTNAAPVPATNDVSVIWSNLPPGRFTLTALATDNSGASSTALPVEIIVRPGHDSFTNRIALSGVAPSISGSNREATVDPGEAMHGGNPGGSSVWYSWTAPKGGTVLLSVTATNFFPLADVYTGASISALTVVAGRDFALDTTNRVMTLHFEAVANREYSVAVDGFAGQAGPFDLALKFPPPPPNDNFADRVPLAGASLTVKSSNLYATKESGEPDKHAGVASSRSVWFSWTAPVSGPVVVTLAGRGTEFIPWPAAYTGNSLTNLVMASGMSVRFDTNTLTTRLTFNAMALTTYALAIDGFNNRTGPINLTLATANLPPAVQSLVVPVILGSGMKLAISGATGQKFALQASTNLIDWTEIFSGLFATNKTEVTDTNSSRFVYRFYRAWPVP